MTTANGLLASNKKSPDPRVKQPQFIKKFALTGAVLIAISLVVNFVTSLSIYDEVGDCLDRTGPCEIDTWQQIVAKLAAWIGYSGVGLILAGGIAWVIGQVRQHK